MWEELLNTIFPEHCIGCEKQGSALCAICERTIITKPVALSGTTAALFNYQNPLVKKAIWALKYKRKKSLGKYFGTALYREFFKQLAYGSKKTHEIILIIPIPAGRKATSIRGYNHAEVIARTIAQSAKNDGLHLVHSPNFLYKKREVPRQVEMRKKSERRENVENLFEVHNGSELTGKTIILIDDVITTGATIDGAKEALRAYRPKRILAVAVAH